MEALFSSLSPNTWWFLIGLILLFAEFMIPGLIVIFFAIGAWVTALICLAFDLPLSIQLISFLAGSIISLALLRHKFTTLFNGLVRQHNENGSDNDGFVGERGVVLIAIAPGEPGKVEIRGTPWNAESETPLSVGQNINVVAVRGLTLKVKQN